MSGLYCINNAERMFASHRWESRSEPDHLMVGDRWKRRSWWMASAISRVEPHSLSERWGQRVPATGEEAQFELHRNGATDEMTELAKTGADRIGAIAPFIALSRAERENGFTGLTVADIVSVRPWSGWTEFDATAGCFSTLKERRTYFASMPNNETPNKRLCENGITPSTSFQWGLFGANRWFDTEIFNSPCALPFSFRNVNRSGTDTCGSSMTKSVSPSFKTHVTVSSSMINAVAFGSWIGSFEIRPGWPSGVTHSIFAPQLIRPEFDEDLVGNEPSSGCALARFAAATAARKTIVPTHAVHEKRSMYI